MLKNTLTWNDRFAIMDKLKPSDEKICQVFGVDQNSLDVARNLRKSGHFVPSKNINIESYANLFDDGKQQTPSIVKTNLEGKSSVTTITTPTSKKRGRKGNKIKTAFNAIPTTPINAETFAKKHQVSLSVLRQGKRFDTKSTGTVHIRKIELNGEKQLCVWRDTPID